MIGGWVKEWFREGGKSGFKDCSAVIRKMTKDYVYLGWSTEGFISVMIAQKTLVHFVLVESAFGVGEKNRK